MKYLLLIACLLIFRIGSTQKKGGNINSTYIIKYHSDSCGVDITYTRKYLNDSVLVDSRLDVSDTFMVKNGIIFKLHRKICYKIIDIDRDFSDSLENSFHYYYYDLFAADTLKHNNEPQIIYNSRLANSIVVYIPIRKLVIRGLTVFMYYLVGDCFPITKECIKARIANGQYAIEYYQKEIGKIGFSASNGKCSNYIISDSSYSLLINWKKSRRNL